MANHVEDDNNLSPLKAMIHDMPRSPNNPEYLVVTLTISEKAPAVRLSVLEATVVGLAGAGHSVSSVLKILGRSRRQLEPTIGRLCKQFECSDAAALWNLFKRKRSKFIDS